MLDNIDLYQKIDKQAYKYVRPERYKRVYDVQKASWFAGIPVIIIFEGWYAAGKRALLQKLNRPLDPRGFKLHSTLPANSLDMKRPWMRRFWLNLPARGEWAIFDRSWYNRVSYERVNHLIPEKVWRRAYRDIVEFERTLIDDGYCIFKFFLHISKQEQKRRYNKLTKDAHTPKSVIDEIWEQQRRFDEWQSAYEEILERTETEWSPWTIVEATNNRYALIKILDTLIISLENRLGWEYIPLTSTDQAESTSHEIEIMKNPTEGSETSGLVDKDSPDENVKKPESSDGSNQGD
jgi:polyphosphate kinase 2 (PPK2 family)